MKKHLLKVILLSSFVLALVSMFTLLSTNHQLSETPSRLVVKAGSEFIEVPPDIDGRTPALIFFTDDPAFPGDALRKLDMQDDTGFNQGLEIYPFINRKD